MPANLPPQFFELQQKLNQTKDIQEKIEILEEMLAICPKHKGTERVQEEIKKKIAKLKKEKPKKASQKEEIYFVKKEGAGQVLILGVPNSGKTSLVNFLCNTDFKVADYPFTTNFPTPGMMRYENLLIQIVDTPPLTQEFKPGWLKNLARQADLILVLIDLSQEPEKNLKEMMEILKEWKIEKEKILIFGNKLDLEEGRKNFEKLKENFEIFGISIKDKINTENLKERIFKALKIIRVYPKEPKKEVDFENPVVLKEGARLIDFVKEIKEEWVEKFKGAKLYEKNLKNFKMVGRDYLLKDGDIVEIKI
jgi:small GTP-binding protein